MFTAINDDCSIFNPSDEATDREASDHSSVIEFQAEFCILVASRFFLIIFISLFYRLPFGLTDFSMQFLTDKFFTALTLIFDPQT